MGWSIDIAVAATHKYAIKESGDVVEIADLPDGGLGIVVADGQGSGPPARMMARAAAAEAWSLLQRGVRAEAVAAAVSDSLFQGRGGKVSVSLDVARLDRTGAIEIARLSTNSLVCFQDGLWNLRSIAAEPSGRYDRQTPIVESFTATEVAAFLIVTDGVVGAGARFESQSIDRRIPALNATVTAAQLADAVFTDALSRDSGRPGDDMTVVACIMKPSSSDQRIDRRSFQRDIR